MLHTQLTFGRDRSFLDSAENAIYHQVFGPRRLRPFNPTAGANITITTDGMSYTIASSGGSGTPDTADDIIAAGAFLQHQPRIRQVRGSGSITVTEDALGYIIGGGGSSTPDTADDIIAAWAFGKRVLPPTGMAGGDLEGVYPNPNIKEEGLVDGIRTFLPHNLPLIPPANDAQSIEANRAHLPHPQYSKGVRAGANVTVTQDAKDFIVAASASGSPDAGDNIDAARAYLQHPPRIPKAQAGTNITIVENAQGPVISAASGGSPDTADNIIASIAFDSRVKLPGGLAGGDLEGTYPNPTVREENLVLGIKSFLPPSGLPQPLHAAAEVVFAGLTLRDQEMNWQATTPAQITASVNDYNPGNGVFFRINADTSGWDITGLAGGINGRVVLFRNTANATIDFLHQSASSAAANRFTFSAASDITVARDQVVLLIYDATTLRWSGSKIVGEHNLLSTTHVDTATNIPVEGSLIVGNATPAWSRLTIGASGTFLKSDGTTASWQAPASGPPTLTTVEKSLVSAPYARRNGSFQITGLSGLTTGKPVFIKQLNGPYTGKGTRADEAEMDQVTVTGEVISATAIQCYWQAGQSKVRGNFKFGYMVGA